METPPSPVEELRAYKDFAAFDLDDLPAALERFRVVSRRLRKQRDIIMRVPMWDTKRRDRKRKRALGVGLAYVYLQEIIAVMDEHPEWKTIMDVPINIREAAAQQAHREVNKVVAES
jgi:hypothetical protein